LHGLAASLVVVARMVGMVLGVSMLTTIGLHAFSTRASALPSPSKLCPSTPWSCPRYDALFTGALTSELTVMFLSAALACGFAAMVVLATQGSVRYERSARAWRRAGRLAPAGQEAEGERSAGR
ncbi:MAG TPA: hypothetical protein VED59_02190, partial [Acidimicrobiales bacterium]|nr:hypothetical protein [Acidimicrobiales bacterium]